MPTFSAVANQPRERPDPFVRGTHDEPARPDDPVALAHAGEALVKRHEASFLGGFFRFGVAGRTAQKPPISSPFSASGPFPTLID
jgi:hypothetical protein